MIEKVRAKTEQRAVALAAHYPAAYLHQLRREQPEPHELRVVFFTSRHTSYIQYATRDLVSGFRELGCKVWVYLEAYDQGVGRCRRHTFHFLQKIKPHLIVSLNNFIPKDLREVCPGLPFLSWVQDPPDHLGRTGRVGDADFVAVTGRRFVRDLREWEPQFRQKAVALIPCITNPNIYQPKPEIEKRYDVSYVGHLRMTPEMRCFYDEETQSDTAYEQLVHQGIARFDAMGWPQFLPIMGCPQQARALVASLPIAPSLNLSKAQRNQLLRFFIYTLAPFCAKRQMIETVLAAGVHRLFLGGSGWEQIPQFASFAGGPVANGSALNEIYNATRINLNMSVYLSYHPKFPETAWSKAFALTIEAGERDIQKVTEFFEAGREVILFQNNTELTACIHTFLGDANRREAVAEAAYQKMRTRFTVRHAAAAMLSMVLQRPIPPTNDHLPVILPSEEP